ncbi:hypothetical protein GCM10009624_24820 [Gordonia sinesedis]
MTRPPDDPRDPRDEPPQTRAFDPDVDPASVGDPTSQYPTGQAYSRQQPAAPYGQDPYGQGYGPGPYGQDPYTAGQYAPGQYGQDPYAAPPPGDGRKQSRRTAGLVLAIVVALVIVVVAAILVVNSSGGDGGSAAPSTTSRAPSTTTTTTTTETTTTTTTTEPTTTTARPPAGAVVYQLTGNGDVVAISYRSGTRSVIVPTSGTPWTQSTQVDGGTAEITAIVIRGSVTCTILQGEQLLASSTSSGGPLRCAAQLGE